MGGCVGVCVCAWCALSLRVPVVCGAGIRGRWVGVEVGGRVGWVVLGWGGGAGGGATRAVVSTIHARRLLRWDPTWDAWGRQRVTASARPRTPAGATMAATPSATHRLRHCCVLRKCTECASAICSMRVKREGDCVGSSHPHRDDIPPFENSRDSQLRAQDVGRCAQRTARPNVSSWALSAHCAPVDDGDR